METAAIRDHYLQLAIEKGNVLTVGNVEPILAVTMETRRSFIFTGFI